ncbi:hypothetical protein [Actinocorallia sp. A-T 12471]|uniref:hypothetical protein n=1 Tax=Actinocorallia sp. A-T 12471 TaxID=3089813 RepID=UPI0029CB8366|nr:hypothetical protein [Actinocorallia sp. A-T 12471]MDX6739107.1 hypothetical protein [Actinocorallia sp. A-T 12471]
MPPMLSAEQRITSTASKASAISAGVLLIGTLLPWLSVTFFSAATLSGVRVWEGKVALVLAFLAGAMALAAMVTSGNRRGMLMGAAICGVLAFIACVVFAFRFGNALDIPPVLGGSEAVALADAGIGLDAGWYLSIAASIALVGFALWGAMAHKQASNVPGMEWVDPGAPGAQTGSSGTHAAGGAAGHTGTHRQP